MRISIFTSSDKTFISSEIKSRTQTHKVDSRILFNDPEKFRKRFILLIEKLFGSGTIEKVEKIIFAINGKIDSNNKRIIKSELLNNLAIDKLFDWFNFAEALSKDFHKDNIHLMSDAYAVTVGTFFTFEKEIEFHALVLYLDEKFEAGVIKNEERFQKFEEGDFKLAQFEDKDVNSVLGNMGIEKILYENKDEIFEKYTENLRIVLKELSKECIDRDLFIRTIIILSSKEEFINKEQLKNAFENINIIYSSEQEFSQIPILGTFQLLDNKKGNQMKIVKIEYWSQDGHKSHVFESYEDFTNHWYAAKPIANSENYYKVVYNDGMVKDVRIGEIETEEELPQFEF